MYYYHNILISFSLFKSVEEKFLKMLSLQALLALVYVLSALCEKPNVPVIVMAYFYNTNNRFILSCFIQQ
ncbi:MAG: hypothetical protein A2275_01320 [Bacteroidetes bacterium RIFOXYA12_FULL_35_11]|nr:MAG: hypothetical protein A2X01_17840 [Bacteroidetes bacterium GWF2_35_48]OFY72435.1 MAG: hypothetical protein A2275_01320 [Bacteroidetes bacterium RIFOXYA12_FULL_35_11]OFY97201.1 MAG: hypothetical protein A2491_14730 [Bacteroidetes bacterium RIFOXYC12_FULL_35_7]